MKQKPADYKMVSYPKSRRFMAAARRSVQRTPRMHGLIEVDVTRARTFLRDHKAKTREALSFTAFIIACVAKAVDEHKSVQAIARLSARSITISSTGHRQHVSPNGSKI